MTCWYRGRVPGGALVEINVIGTRDLNLRQLRHLIKTLTMMAGWAEEDNLRAGPEDSCIGRGEEP